MVMTVESLAPPRTRRKCVVVNCSETRYHVVRAAAALLGWCVEDGAQGDIPETFHGVPMRFNSDHLAERLAPSGGRYDPTSSPQCIWLDKSVVPARVAALSCHHRINHFPGMHIIARKATLFKRLMRIRRRAALNSSLAVALQCFPWSFAPTTDVSLLEAFLTQHRSTAAETPFFIFKPNKGCQGKGITMTPDPMETVAGMSNTIRDDCLIQEYISPPLCVDGKKFDLRVYVLLTSVVEGECPKRCVRKGGGVVSQGQSSIPRIDSGVLSGLRLFVHREGLVRICAEQYVLPTLQNCHRASIHLTNYAVNKTAEGFSIGEAMTEKGGVCDGNKRDFTFLQRYIEMLAGEEGPTVWESVLRRIDECILLTILSGWEELQREFVGTGAARGSRSDGRNCFELLGFDLMLTESLQPTLMEVNHSPSLFCDSPFDFETKRRVVSDVFRQLEPHIPSLEHCGAASYAAHEAKARAKGNDRTVQKTEFAASGFRQIAPQRDGDAWREEEMQMFGEMLQMTRQR